MEDLKQAVKSAAKEVFPFIREVRRRIHQNPELSFEEFKTSALLKKCLDDAGIPYTEGWVKTGISATISGTGSNTIALRADMDALPINERSSKPYASSVPGVMHACGHDVHSASVLGAGLILNRIREKLNGTVQLIFQPGEEKLPGGARLMLEEGIFDAAKPAAIIAQHVYPSLPAGKVGFRPGRYMASTDEIYITLRGKGGHGAMAHQLHDPVLAASQVVVALQQVSSRFAPAVIPTVLSIGRFIAEGATNVIPDEVLLEGTFRSMDENWRQKAHEHIYRIVTDTARAFGVKAEVDIQRGYPVLHNNEKLTLRCMDEARSFLGSENVTELDLRMTAEDFAWFAQEYPACFYRLGTAGENGAFTSGVHTSTFDIEEAALETGSGLLAWLALRELEKNSGNHS